MSRRCSIALVVLVAACQQAQSPPPASSPPFKAAATTKQLMNEVIEPAADLYWDAVGTVTDKYGTVEKAPKTDDQWNALRNAAMVIAESGNLLMIEPRAQDHDQWMTLSRALVEVGARARTAAESKNRTAVFDVGAEVYDACVNCHSKYMPGVATPAK